MQTVENHIIVIARSARMFAESLDMAGIKVHVIDQFGDIDTQASASRVCVVDELSSNLIVSEINVLNPDKKTSIIYGSGVDNNFELLKLLSLRFNLLGNHVNTVRKVREPRLFFSLLKELGINFPETRFYYPSGDNWLFKCNSMEGGLGIKPARLYGSAQMEETSYFQQQLNGQSFSVLFLANGCSNSIIGCNSQWVVDESGEHPYLFQGVISHFELETSHLETLRGWIQRIVIATGLKGLNTLDCLLVDNEIYVLEINPRPSASAELYDQDYENGLFRLHIASFQDDWSTVPYTAEKTQVRGIWILYASCELRISERLEWPTWVADRPAGGAVFRRGDPVCSVKASGKCTEEVKQRLTERCDMVTRRLSSVLHDNTFNLSKQSVNNECLEQSFV